MKTVKILVCSHKKDVRLPDMAMYLPIQLGAALSEDHWGILRDDQGENISNKNRLYCELSAHFWAWKNLTGADYIGLAHYRRYLDVSNERKVEQLLNKHDIILPIPLTLPHTNMFNLQEVLTREDVYIMMTCLKKLYPDYIVSANKYLMLSNKNIRCNMFITSKKIFDDYSQWLFEILFETEKYIRLSGYTRLKRVYGYFGEVLLPIYVLHNNLNVKYVHMIDYPGNSTSMFKKWLKNINGLRKDICFKLMSPYDKEYNPYPSTITSMKADNLPIY